ncbi:hypothetical protein ANANG_G00197200 [Anguilla anguilla]|uniref:Uncharacterized protein n=1 Tax=Anguilla anguilla TaxID=7936 RepID=A0A9D3RSG7_ANGAN|nr:hypothetical protein ANANG_G00197200 [Anguilla anguilla]
MSVGSTTGPDLRRSPAFKITVVRPEHGGLWASTNACRPSDGGEQRDKPGHSTLAGQMDLGETMSLSSVLSVLRTPQSVLPAQGLQPEISRMRGQGHVT